MITVTATQPVMLFAVIVRFSAPLAHPLTERAEANTRAGEGKKTKNSGETIMFTFLRIVNYAARHSVRSFAHHPPALVCSRSASNMVIAIQRFGDFDAMNLVIDFELALLATCTVTGMA